MNIKQLQYFLTIAQCGNISAAAKKLHISQPPLSNQLKLLEQELGVTLIERGSRSVELTDAGKLLYNRAETIIDITDATKKEVSSFGQGRRGTIHLGTISSCGSTLLATCIPAFQIKYPDVHFELYEGNTFQLIDKLRDGFIEIAVVRTPFPTSEFDSIFLEKEPMIAAALPDYFTDIHEKNIQIHQLSHKPLIYYRRFDELITSCFHKYNKVPDIYCKNDDARTSLMWADHGLGIAITPQSIFPCIHSHNLIYKIIDEPEMYTNICAITRKNQYISDAGKSFLSVFKETSKKDSE